MKNCCDVAAMFGVRCLDCNPVKRAPRGAPRAKNSCAKTVTRENAYEVWQGGDWTWYVLKKYQANDDAPAARWFCCVTSPAVGPRGELGDVYVAEIKNNARRIR
jgi:hypothetical protein